MESLRVYFLGTFRLYRDGVLLTSKDWQIRNARQLFKLLFTERNHTISADKVIDLLWPYSADHAHKTLRSAISILRTVLEPTREPQGPSRFVPRGSTGYKLQLPDDNCIWVDVLEFERLLDVVKGSYDSLKKRKTVESALQLYTGDYLVEDGREYWAMAERTRLRERYFTSVLALMEAQRDLELYSEAIAIGRKALAIDTCREPIYPLIMYCQATLGDTVGALQTFEQCRQELHAHLGVDPSPQTLALHTELLRGEFRPASQLIIKQTLRATGSSQVVHVQSSVENKDIAKKYTQETPLVTYNDHFMWLTQQLRFLKEERTRIRGPRIIACSGEMGVGKSFLLRNILNYARKLPVTTLTTACQEIEQGVAFASLTAMMKVWLRETSDEELATLPSSMLAILAHVLPELLTRIATLVPATFLCPEHMYSALTTAFVDAFSALSTKHPLLIAIDDLQWIDETSLVVLHRLASLVLAPGSERNSLLIFFTYRPEDTLEHPLLNATLLSLGRCAPFRAIQLQRFCLGEIEAYLREHDATYTLVGERVYAVTQGNALLLTEAVRMLNEQRGHVTHLQKLRRHNPLMNALLHSRVVENAVLARIARLPQRALELLEYAAVIGRPFPADLLGPALSSDDYKALDILLARQFLREQESAVQDVYLAFVHEVVAQIVYTFCSAVKRSQLHRYIAEQLIRYYANTTYTHASEIAHHYRHAGPQYQTQALHYEVQVESFLMHTNIRNV